MKSATSLKNVKDALSKFTCDEPKSSSSLLDSKLERERKSRKRQMIESGSEEENAVAAEESFDDFGPIVEAEKILAKEMKLKKMKKEELFKHYVRVKTERDALQKKVKDLERLNKKKDKSQDSNYDEEEEEEEDND
ncbi:uncharacterized protein LOC113211389 [Frankliniella occidentalis]|uniref:Uncharacterized protein LOC113211389 n=1 Tax=Frankliniella occidentalis TaxID=133901 RepID=A0A6J1SW94_FRAOC|nr:uncharacterized protein LOC113211389 [Frankliniella occidentalis]